MHRDLGISTSSTVRTDTLEASFATHAEQRLLYDDIVTTVSFEIIDWKGRGEIKIKGLNIGYVFWDKASYG